MTSRLPIKGQQDGPSRKSLLQLISELNERSNDENNNMNNATDNSNGNSNRYSDDMSPEASERTPLLQAHNGSTSSTLAPTPAPASAPAGSPYSQSNSYNNNSDVEQGLSGTAVSPQIPTATPAAIITTRPRQWKKIYSDSIVTIGLLLLLCFLTVAIASWISQRVLDNALILNIQKTSIHDMDDSGFQIDIKSEILLDSSNDGFFGLTGLVQQAFHPTVTLQPTTLTLSTPSMQNDIFMAEFDVEEQRMPLGQSLQLDISAYVRVTNSSLMADFFSRTLQQSTADLVIRGPIYTKLGLLWYTKLRLDRVVPMDGLQGIQNAALTSMELPENNPLGGISMSGIARIHNPSKVLSMQMGAVTFGIYLPSKTHPEVDFYQIAEVSTSQLELKSHQSNDIELSGRLFHLDDWHKTTMGQEIAHFGSISEKQLLLGQLLSRFIQGDNSTIQVRALSKAPNVPPWLSEVFKSIVLQMIFPGSPNKDFIQSLDMNELDFGFSDNKRQALLSGQLSSVLQLPPNVTFPIKLLRMKPTAWIKAPGGDKHMASLGISAFLPTISRQNGDTLEVYLDMKQTPLEVESGQMEAFYQFLNSSFTQDWIHLGIVGEAVAEVETGLGTFELGPIPFDVITTQRGLGGLVGVAPLLEKLDVIGSSENSLTVEATLVLWNPSNISATLGDLSFLLSHGGYIIGMATVTDGQVLPGNNTIRCIGIMDPSIDCKRKHSPNCNMEPARNASREFISKYISGDNTTTLDVLGHANSTHIPLLQPMLSTFTITSYLPAIEQDFLLSATMYLLSHSLVLELLNPLDAMITVLYLNGTAFYKDEPLGHILVNFEHDIGSPKPILIPANDHQNETSGYARTPRLPVTLELFSAGYEALRKALGGTLEVDVLCHIKAKVGNMPMWVDFYKDGLSANVRKGF
ncbi:hypothetical protein BX616_004831 [Lobosporangium transversale]|uniref:Tag1-like fifth Ig-like domain-containing protein n=1 Tax=Lobosporangium transversale TaxID=64571 RepID=A0A1Y2GWD2_9FUNG|nr:hypothetical protein BCR41DRAFT_419577 [Lobosporangium transversale]KAF9916018.1 hypothetical protein BX616_004831 [Lobosporangium transversale]ORZ26577.1 hypothetical protein BCR41DRAFT_419577 [Lobosporangium transversale]|eukprot:XP_021884340.1 hypothetical protein BCR41DRAFT_419577 [Lobosporangium transversale]